jgi:hypothetical protein
MQWDIFQLLANRLVSDCVAFYYSPFFLVIKILLGVYVFVLLANLILLIIQRNFIVNVKEGFTIGMNVPIELTTHRKKLKKQWLKMKEALKSGEEAKYKIAIIEADEKIDNLLQRIGFEGENMTERLEKIHVGQLDNVAELQEAHAIKNRIVHEDDFRIDQAEAERVFGLYEKFLDYFGVLD